MGKNLKKTLRFPQFLFQTQGAISINVQVKRRCRFVFGFGFSFLSFLSFFFFFTFFFFVLLFGCFATCVVGVNVSSIACVPSRPRWSVR